MRKNWIAMLAVTLFCVGVCAHSLTHVTRVSGQMDAMRMEVMDMAEQGDIDGAQAGLGRMAEAWSRCEPVMETILQHDALREIAMLIIEGDANLTAGDRDDFNRSMALLGEAIDHLCAEERPGWSNIL